MFGIGFGMHQVTSDVIEPSDQTGSDAGAGHSANKRWGEIAGTNISGS